MATKPTYWELLKHPNWQRKRLEVLQRENFTCQSCGAKESTLHVHHSYYEKGKAPWEYPSESLKVVCEACHEYAQTTMTSLQRQIGRLDVWDVDRLHGYAVGVEIYNTLDFPGFLHIYSESFAHGLADVIHRNYTVVLRLCNSRMELSAATLKNLLLNAPDPLLWDWIDANKEPE